ncbi:MAG: hypothetical protein M1820_000446 [Bogoriella megaspora]|nr:MAG: hypothetical protein M1820_000446 [Bogoriella megaspora]
MAVYWVQQWIALPVIVEEHMGEAGDVGRLPQDLSRREYTGNPNQSLLVGYPDTSAPKSTEPHPFGTDTANHPFFSQYSSIPQMQQQPHDPHSSGDQGHQSYNSAPAHEMNPHSFNLSSMADALPNYPGGQPQPGIHQRSPQPQQLGQQQLSGASTSALVYQLQQISQYPGQPGAASYPGQIGANAGFGPNAFPNAYSQRSAGPSPTQQTYPQHPQSQPYYYYPQPFSQSAPSPNFPGHQAQMGNIFDRRFGAQNAPGVSQVPPQAFQQQLRLAPCASQNAMTSPMSSAGLSRQASDPNLTISIPRGPPRKPKQSGHALWVGNLPPGTTVLELKDHFSRDATQDIESLFLISKSNCAFVNYRTEASCVAAMHRFHDSRFNGVRLVCRLRRSSTPSSGVPTGPAAMATGSSTNQRPSSDGDQGEQFGNAEPQRLEQPVEEPSERKTDSEAKVPEKYFVVKSLTLQDLEASVRNGIWATQAHNESALNKAFETADNVYLIFSANKSGEYFGYARMASPISGDASKYIGSLPQPEEQNSAATPKSIPTAATAWAPKGRIIDDSARGTIFWEADRSDDEEEQLQTDDVVDESKLTTEGGSSPNITASQDWGKPFKLEWLSTQRLPFYRTRGLRNPWNANREVKIARDGTELEPTIGRRLIQMFQRMGPPSQGSVVGGSAQVPQMVGSQPHLRPY